VTLYCDPLKDDSFSAEVGEGFEEFRTQSTLGRSILDGTDRLDEALRWSLLWKADRWVIIGQAGDVWSGRSTQGP